MKTHNEYLKQMEVYLDDLEIIQKSRILNEAYQELNGKDVSELPPILDYTNQKRSEHGLIPYQKKKKFSLIGYIFKFSAVMMLILFSFIGFLIWKFTPIIKIDEEANRVIILGGLIDIDGKSGKLKVFDDYHFSHEGFSNDFQASINLDEKQDEIIINFNSGSFNLTTSNSDQFSVDCKLATQPLPQTISQSDDTLTLDFSKIEGLNCSLEVPTDKKVTIEGNYASITAISPEYNLYIEVKNGKVYLTPEEEIDYNYSLNIENADNVNNYIGEFQSSGNEESFEIRINLKDGAIIRK